MAIYYVLPPMPDKTYEVNTANMFRLTVIKMLKA